MYSAILGIVQASFTLILFVITLAGLIFVFKRDPLRAIYRISPVIASQLFVNALSLSGVIPVCVFLDLTVTSRFLDVTNADIVRAVVMSSIVMELFVLFHDITSLGIMLERILAFRPILNIAKTNFVIAVTAIAVTVILAIVQIWAHAVSLPLVQVIRPDCFYTSCIIENSIARILIIYIRLSLSTINVLLGVALVIVLHRTVSVATERKVNRVVKYEFLFRCLLQTLPYFADLISTSFNFSIGYYLGAYSMQFFALDVAATTFVYGKMLRGHLKGLTRTISL